jgi:lysozyme
MMTLGAAGVALIKEFEGCRLEAYVDERGIPTIGYGHTAGVKLGATCSQTQADAWLLDDTHWAALEVIKSVDVPITQNQFDALVCFVFNVGSGNWMASTLRRLVNAKSIQFAAEEFVKWDHVNGSPDPGLLRRRQAEQRLFLTP